MDLNKNNLKPEKIIEEEKIIDNNVEFKESQKETKQDKREGSDLKEDNLVNKQNQLQKKEKKSDILLSAKDEKIINYLLDIVKRKGIIDAIKEAEKMNDPFIIDKFHDILIEKGYKKDD